MARQWGDKPAPGGIGETGGISQETTLYRWLYRAYNELSARRDALVEACYGAGQGIYGTG